MAVSSDEPTGRPARILDAAYQLILKQGFKKTSMSQIAAKARVAKGTTYSYWASKEELFVELVIRSVLKSLETLERAVEQEPALAEPGRLISRMVQIVREDELLYAGQQGDVELLEDLLESEELTLYLRKHGAIAVVQDMLPVWSATGLAQDVSDNSLLIDSLSIIVLGYFTTLQRNELLIGREKAVPLALENSVRKILTASQGFEQLSLPQQAQLTQKSLDVIKTHQRELQEELHRRAV